MSLLVRQQTNNEYMAERLYQFALATCNRVMDGRTAVFRFGLEAPDSTELYPYTYITCRLVGYNVADCRSADPRESRWGLICTYVLEEMILNKLLIVHIGGVDTDGVHLVQVRRVDSGLDVCRWMIDNNYAVPQGSATWEPSSINQSLLNSS